MIRFISDTTPLLRILGFWTQNYLIVDCERLIIGFDLVLLL